MCRTFHVLPEVGGMLDQDSYFAHMVTVVLSAEEDRRKLDKAMREMQERH